MELYFLLVALGATLIFWFLLNQFYHQRYEIFVKSFLDSNINITILYNGDKISFINRAGLEFFGFSSVKEFNASYTSFSNLFLLEEGYLDKHTYGKKWLKFLNSENYKERKIKLSSARDNRKYSFYIKVSQMKRGNQYLLSLNDITLLEDEKLKMRELAEYDLLTNIYNRVKLNEVLNSFIYRANRYDLKFSIVLLDIDHFKLINDTYGHAIGDKVLVTLTALIKTMLREEDIFARWGGEEFVIALESTSSKEASFLAQRLRKEIEKFSFETVGQVTCSFGVTEFQAGDKISLLFDRVDKALYEAKEGGRNQVVSK